MDDTYWISAANVLMTSFILKKPYGELRSFSHSPGFFGDLRWGMGHGASPSDEEKYPSYPLVNIQKAMENGHWNSGFSHWKWWFSIAMLVHQRVNLLVMDVSCHQKKVPRPHGYWKSKTSKLILHEIVCVIQRSWNQFLEGFSFLSKNLDLDNLGKDQYLWNLGWWKSMYPTATNSYVGGSTLGISWACVVMYQQPHAGPWWSSDRWSET